MKKVLMPLAILSLMSLSYSAKADNTTTTDPTVPTEVGNTTMPAGQYTMTDQSTGKKYSLMVTTKGTMIFGPAPTTPANAAAVPTAKPGASGITGLAESQIQKGVTGLVEKQGMNEIKNFIK